MTTFTIDTDNIITAFAAAVQVPEGQDRFATEKEFAKLSADWPITRFPEIWNAFAGAPPFGDLKPVKKFTDRKTAVNRNWKAIQRLRGTAARQYPRHGSQTEGHTGTDAHPRATGGPRPIEESQGGQAGHREGWGVHDARGQQEGHRPRHAEAARRGDTQGHHVRHRMAGA